VPKSCAFVLLKHTASRIVGYTENLSSPLAIRTIYPFFISSYKVKCTLVQALRLCTDRTAHRFLSGLFQSGLFTKTLYLPIVSPIRATCLTHVILLGLINHLNAELNPTCNLLILLGDLTFMGKCIVSISNKIQR
jgi:hypothetical protein